MLRDEKKAGTSLGLEAHQLTSQGKLLPDSVINDLVKNWLGDHHDSFVFDGFPRSVGQAEALEGFLSEQKASLDLALLLEVNKQTILDRVERRVMCSQCGSIFSVGLHIVAQEAGCPKCGGQLAKRSDDNVETVEARLVEYAEKTEPVIAFYEQRGLLKRVDASLEPKVVFRSIEQILEAA